MESPALFDLDCTLVLNLLAIAASAGLVWLKRRGAARSAARRAQRQHALTRSTHIPLRAYDQGMPFIDAVIALRGILIVAAAAVIVPLAVLATDSGDSADPAVVTLSSDQIPAPGEAPLQVAGGRFWLVNLAAGEGTYRDFGTPGPGGLLALYWRDPHLGCTVIWRPNFDFEGKTGWFRNPCHGETYTKAGVRVFGPAPRSLDTFAVEVRDDRSVDVHMDRLTLGSDDNPLRAVPYRSR